MKELSEQRIASATSDNNFPLELTFIYNERITLIWSCEIKYWCNGYGIGFDSRSDFSLSNGEFGKNVIMFGVDNSYSAHVDNRQKVLDILDDTKIIADAKYAINFTKSRTDNGSNSFLYTNGVKSYQFTTQIFVNI